MCYPVSKAIAQLIPQRRWDTESSEVQKPIWDAALRHSERKNGKLGASGK
jgi:hypothetical protein